MKGYGFIHNRQVSWCQGSWCQSCFYEFRCVSLQKEQNKAKTIYIVFAGAKRERIGLNKYVKSVLCCFKYEWMDG